MEVSKLNGKSANGNEAKNHHAEHKQSTKSLHSGALPSYWTDSPVVPPLYMSSTYETLTPGVAVYEYSRCGNPTRTELEDYLKALEGAKYALSFSSGLGSITTVSYLLKSQDHILCVDDVYGGTHRFFSDCLPRMGIETSFIEGTKIENWTENFRMGQTKLVWIETPSNPTMKIVDVEKIVSIIKELDKECIVVVDNTFMSPVFQNPLTMGADIVMHSCTKYINGHSDVVMGALMMNNDEIYDRLKYLQSSLGIVPSPFDCSQVIRSIKTLNVRVRQQASNAMKIAEFLEGHKNIKRVLYPGLKSHPQHDLASQQYSGFGGMLSFYVDTVKGDEVIKMVQAVKVFKLAVSLGCVCSLIEIPFIMTHSAITEPKRIKLGITENLVRLSAGLEDSQDLIDDLKQALDSVFGAIKV